MTTSYEKLVIDLEIVSRVMRLREGMDTTDKEQTVNLIQEIGHQGSYITHLNTLTHFRERWLPGLSDWESYASWQEKGSEDVAIKANRKFKEILQSTPQTLIDPEVDQALNDYIRRAL
jgi:trimethylamine--corrinoid protein Co-methyltransferase